MRMRDARIILHAAVTKYGENARVRCIVLSPTYLVVDVQPMEGRYAQENRRTRFGDAPPKVN